jgi:hypothetical protein
MARNNGVAFAKKAVSPDSVDELLMALWTKNKVDGHTCIHNIAITASLTTTRYRRGDNQAYIAFFNQDTAESEIWHVKLPKLSEEEHAEMLNAGKGGPFEGHKLFEQRAMEDGIVTAAVLRLACGFQPKLLEQDKFDGTLTRVNP